jgi:hypothetical protein
MSTGRSGRLFAAAVGVALVAAGTGRAGIIAINNPNGAYQALTTKVPIPQPAPINSGSPGFVSSISGGGLTVGIANTNSAMGVESRVFTPGVVQPPNNGWATWGNLPQVESTNPGGVLFSGLPPKAATNTTLTLTFDHPVAAFGLEAQPGQFDAYNITATFFNGSTNLGSITRTVDGLGQPLNNTSDAATAGALLFAATITPGSPEFTSVQLSVPEGVLGSIAATPGASGEAFAQARFSELPLSVVNGEVVGVVPEPATVVLLGVGLGALVVARRLRRPRRGGGIV